MKYLRDHKKPCVFKISFKMNKFRLHVLYGDVQGKVYAPHAKGL